MKKLSMIIFFTALTFWGCEQEEMLDLALNPEPAPEIIIPGDQILGVLDLESPYGNMITSIQALIEEVDIWDKNYGILPQLKNILKKLEGGDLDNSITKLYDLLNHLNELLVDPDGPIYGDPDAETAIQNLIAAIEAILEEGILCSGQSSYQQLIIVDDDPNDGEIADIIMIRVYIIEPEIKILDFRITCEEQLESIPYCLVLVLRDDIRDIIDQQLSFCE